MAWYTYLADFLGGVFLVNGIPHFIHGISGKKFYSPFASPPGTGESSPLVNVIWGMVNFLIGYGLLFGAGEFDFSFDIDTMMTGIGALVTAVGLSLYFGRVRHS